MRYTIPRFAEFKRVCVEFLNLEKPVQIRTKEAGRRIFDFEKGAAAAGYRFNRGKHEIEAHRTSGRGNIKTLLAHEFVHAWQEEHDPKGSDHGLRFQEKAEQLKAVLKSKGFVIGRIYIKELDL